MLLLGLSRIHEFIHAKKYVFINYNLLRMVMNNSLSHTGMHVYVRECAWVHVLVHLQ